MAPRKKQAPQPENKPGKKTAGSKESNSNTTAAKNKKSSAAKTSKTRAGNPKTGNQSRAKAAKTTGAAATRKKATSTAAKPKTTKKPAKPRGFKGVVEGPSFTAEYNNSIIFILGTAHVSRQSVEDVQSLIEKEKPDLVCVELCQSRYDAHKDPDRWKKLDIVQVIKQKKVYLLMSSIILSAFQKKMGELTETNPGEEILTAIELAEDKNIPLELIDRDVQITLKRAWQGIGYFRKMFIVSELIASLIVKPEETTRDEIENLKKKDMLEDMFSNLPKRYNHVTKIIIEERDIYLAEKIKKAVEKNPDARRVVAVVGAGHLPGIEKYIDEENDHTRLETLKKKSAFWGAVKFFLPIFIIMGLVYAFTDTSNTDAILNNLIAWIVIKASISGLFALIFLAHPLAILAAAATAPISNFNPVLKPGWVAALIEAKFHKPSVEDFENIADDSSSFKGFFKNKVIRIFNIFTFPQIGSSIATGLALWYMSQTG